MVQPLPMGQTQPYPPATPPQNNQQQAQNSQVRQLAAATKNKGMQTFIPANMIVDANNKLASAMGNYETATATAKEQGDAYTRSGEMMKLMNDKTPAKHWTGAVAKGLQGWAMRKERKKGAEASSKEAAALAQAAVSKQNYERAVEDKKFARDLQKAEHAESIKQTKETEWEYRRNGFDRKEQIENLIKAGDDIDPLMQHRDEVFDRYMQEKRDNSTRAGGNIPSSTKNEMGNDARQAILGKRQLDRIRADFDPSLFGAIPSVQQGVGAFTMWAGDVIPQGWRPREWEQLSLKRKAFDTNLYSYANRLIKLRSGAAVTEQEFNRFKQEFPIGMFQSAESFEIMLNQHIRNVAMEQLDNQYMLGMFVDEESGKLRMAEDGDPLMTTETYTQKQEEIYDIYGTDDWRGGMPTTTAPAAPAAPDQSGLQNPSNQSQGKWEETKTYQGKNYGRIGTQWYEVDG